MTDLLQVQTVTSPTAGVQLVQVATSTIPGEIEAGDLLRIDFDKHQVIKDGFYVLKRDRWTGVRRCTDTPLSPKVYDGGKWIVLPAGVQILGYVDMVYTARRAAARWEVDRG